MQLILQAQENEHQHREHLSARTSRNQRGNQLCLEKLKPGNHTQRPRYRVWQLANFYGKLSRNRRVSVVPLPLIGHRLQIHKSLRLGPITKVLCERLQHVSATTRRVLLSCNLWGVLAQYPLFGKQPTFLGSICIKTPFSVHFLLIFSMCVTWNANSVVVE